MFEYRPKFVDIRVRPPKAGEEEQKAAREEDVFHLKPGQRPCDRAGCRLPADAKAPKSRTMQNEFYWFCQRHAAEYNQTYDFFDGMTEAEITAFQASATYGHKQTWRMGGGPIGAAGRAARLNPNRWRGRHWFDNGEGEAERTPQQRDRTRLQTRALDELELPHHATPEQVREKYGILIKRFHPDSNGGDRSMEGKLNLVIRAYKALKSSGLA